MRDERGFAEFAAERGGALRRQALLLSGEPARAARMADSALAETARRWDRYAARGGAAAAEAHVRRVLATAAARRQPGALAPAAGSGGDTDLVWRALASLPPRRRVVLVLHADEGLDDGAIGERLGLPAGTVAAERAAGMAALRGVLLRRGRPEDLLPVALADPTRALPPADLPEPPAPGGRRSRRRLLHAGAAAAVLAAAVLVPALTGGEVADPEPDAVAAGGLGWAARGPLAGDRDLLQAALRAWRDSVPAGQRPVAAAALYAGSPDGTPVVLLQGADVAGLGWAAEIVDTGGSLALSRTEPLGRAVPLLALSAGGLGRAVRLLTPPGTTGPLLVRDPDLTPAAPLRRLPVDADGLSEPLDPGAAGVRVVVVGGGGQPAVAGSGLVAPGRLSAVTGTVEIGPGSLPLAGSTDVRPVWYADGELVAAKLGGPVVVAAAGPVLAAALPARPRPRRLEARTYEARRGGDRYLVTVLRLDGAPTCLDTAALGAAGGADALPVVARRCLPAGLRDGVLHVVAGPRVAEVRLRLPVRAGRPARTVSLRRPAGQPAGTGFVALTRVAGLPARGGRGDAYAAGGGLVARLTLGPSSGPRG